MGSSIHSWIQSKTESLINLGFEDDANFSCTQLMLHELKQNRSYLLTHPDQPLFEKQSAGLEANFLKLQQGIPLPYILGEWDFFGLTFKVSPEVLIPRPETELLVEIAIRWLKLQNPHNRRMIDVGTGSGCIPIAILKNSTHVSGLAVDRSLKAIKIASDNVNNHHMNHQKLSLICSDLLSALNGHFNLITANLPYIPQSKLKNLTVLKYEPELALNGGVDGLTLIRELLIQATQHLASPGLMLLEIEAEQGESVVTLAKKAFPTAQVQVIKDYTNRDRIVRIER